MMGPHYHSPVSPDGTSVVLRDISGHIVLGDLKWYHKQYLHLCSHIHIGSEVIKRYVAYSMGHRMVKMMHIERHPDEHLR
jgi:hypothetical protein